MCLSFKRTLDLRAAESAPQRRIAIQPPAGADLISRQQLNAYEGALNEVGQ